MLYDDGENFVSIICSEKQGSDAGLQELYRLGLMKSTVSPVTFTGNPGMVSRVFYDEKGRITGHEVLDKFGQKINIPHGTFPSPEGQSLSPVFNPPSPPFSKGGLGGLNFGEFKAALERLTKDVPPLKAVEELTQIHDHLAGWNTGGKDRGALTHIAREHINAVLDHTNGGSGGPRLTVAD